MSLASDLLSTFNSMADITENGEEYFAEHITADIKNYFEGLTVTTANVAGTTPSSSPSGVFSAGAGTGHPDCSAVYGACDSAILTAEISMRSMTEGGNEFFASALSNAIHAMCTGSVAEFNVTGILTPPYPMSPIPAYTGKVKGNPTGQNATMMAEILSTFTSMNNITEDGDRYFADHLASAVEKYAKLLTVSLIGQGVLVGALGTGTIG